jgi:hypothetical protein
MNTIIASKKENKELIARAGRLNYMLEKMGKTARIKYVQCWKNNVCLDGYTIFTPGFNAAPTLYYDPMWDNVSDEALLDELIYLSEDKTTNISIETIMSREYILANVKPKLVGIANEEQIKKNHYVFVKHLDFCILFTVEVTGLADKNEVGTYTVRDDHMLEAGLDSQELFVAAVKNAGKDTDIVNLISYIKEKTENQYDLTDEDDLMPIYIVTNKRKCDGASCILNSDVCKHLQELLNSDELLVIPSSIHETLVTIPTMQAIEGLNDFVAQVNSTLRPEDVLTDSIYIYRDDKLNLIRK